MKLEEILAAIRPLSADEMRPLLDGVKDIFHEKSVCSTCGGVIDDRRCWYCYETRVDLDPV